MYVGMLKSSLINGVRVVTLVVRFPRIILAELNTHRVFSRNYQSSRAKPIEKVIQEDLTYNPTYYGWRKASKGMSPTEFFDEKTSYELGTIWHESKCRAIETAQKLSQAGVAKEIVNRVLEPYMEITGIITSTEWNNFFNLRCAESAQIEIRELAKEMKRVIESETPIERDYHLPYIEDSNCFSREYLIQQIKQSVARCARVSYFSFDKKESTVEKDIELYNRLFESKHLSPFEHVVMNYETSRFLFEKDSLYWRVMCSQERSGNFSKGVSQLRKLLELGVEI